MFYDCTCGAKHSDGISHRGSAVDCWDADFFYWCGTGDAPIDERVGYFLVVALFVPKDFLSVAFHSGGVTTGPMTVPFIMALGVGISAI